MVWPWADEAKSLLLIESLDSVVDVSWDLLEGQVACKKGCPFLRTRPHHCVNGEREREREESSLSLSLSLKELASLIDY